MTINTYGAQVAQSCGDDWEGPEVQELRPRAAPTRMMTRVIFMVFVG
jgi:hypothetical protein